MMGFVVVLARRRGLVRPDNRHDSKASSAMSPSAPPSSDALRQAFIAGALAMREAAVLAAEEVKPRQSRHTGEQYAPEDFVNAIGDIDPISLIPA